MIALAAAAFAGEHDAPAVAPVSVAATPIPVGPPRTAAVTPGEPVQAALAALPAGSTLVLRAGRHPGPLVVDRAVVLTGEPGAVLDGAGSGTVLVVAAPDVTVRDLRVTGGGHRPEQDDSGVLVAADRVVLERVTVDDVYLGIDLRQAHDGAVRGCVVTGDPGAAFGLRGDGIRLWESDRNTIAGNRLSSVRDLVVWYSDDNRFVDNEVRSSRYGIHLMHTAGNRLEGNRFEHDVVGVFVMYSAGITLTGNTVTGAHGAAGIGMGFKESDGVVVEGNILADGTTGFYVDTTPHDLGGEARFAGNLVAANDVGVRFHGPSTGARFAGNAFVANRTPASADERGRATNASFEGNHWSDYAGYDLDGDGVGDLPYAVRSASGRLLDRHPDLAWLSGSPALALVDLFVAAFPMFAPSPVITDPAPSLLDPGRSP